MGHRFEGVGIGVGTENANTPTLGSFAEIALDGRALSTYFAEARSEDQRVLDALRTDLVDEPGDDRRCDIDHRELDGVGNLGHGCVDGDASRRAPSRVHEIPPCTEAVVTIVQFVSGDGGCTVDATDDRRAVRMKE